MADCRITCIRKPNPMSSHEHITHAGNPSANWFWTREEIIQSIENNQNSFYVMDDITGKRSYVGVVKVSGRNPFLRTHSDGVWNDNLLSLVQCPFNW